METSSNLLRIQKISALNASGHYHGDKLEIDPCYAAGLYGLRSISMRMFFPAMISGLKSGIRTPAPVDPPKVLVIHGIYRYTRNPMYLSILIVLISESLIFGNIMLLFYTLVVAFGFRLFVVYHEEPYLRARFSEAYNEYCKKVPRWLIGRHS